MSSVTTGSTERVRLMIFQPYCDRPTCFSTYHGINSLGICEWCGVKLVDATSEVSEISPERAMKEPPNADAVDRPVANQHDQSTREKDVTLPPPEQEPKP